MRRYLSSGAPRSSLFIFLTPIFFKTAAYSPEHVLPPRKMPGAVVGNATRIWELNVHWTLSSQCGVWDPRSRGVDIWECIRDHQSTPGTQPPNVVYWRYVARR